MNTTSLEEQYRQRAAQELVYRLEDRPPFLESLYAGLQHLLAIIVAIGVPPLIVALSMGASAETVAYLVNMSLFVSGIATFIQCKTFGPVGSGMLTIQGTSFSFVGTLVVMGIALTKEFEAAGMAHDPAVQKALGILFGTCLAGSFIQMIASRFMGFVQKLITPLMSGIIVTIIGASLMGVAMKDIGGGPVLFDTNFEQFGHPLYLMLGLGVTLVVVLISRSKNKYARIGSVVFGLAIGWAVALIVGAFTDAIYIKNLSEIWKDISSAGLVTIPRPFAFGLGFRIDVFIPVAFIYLMTLIEAYGDLTATSLVSGQPISGDVYAKRIAAGELGDGVNSALASIFGTMPNTTFSQNNGVIAMTGVASRYVGYFVAGLLVLFGLLPPIGALFVSIPPSVMGGATLVMFGTVMVSGIRIIASSIINRRDIIIMAISLGLGIGVMVVPELWKNVPSSLLRMLLGNPITLSGISAIVVNLLLPQSLAELDADGLEDPMRL